MVPAGSLNWSSHVREVLQDPLVLLGDDEDPDVVDIDRGALELPGGEILVPGGDGLADDVRALEAQRSDADDHRAVLRPSFG